MKKTLLFVFALLIVLEKLHSQPGETSITAGPFISLTNTVAGTRPLKAGIGVEAMFQYNLTNKSVLLFQTSFASHGVKNTSGADTGRNGSINIFSARVGYKYMLGNSGFFINGLTGIDKRTNLTSELSLGIGAGKRINITEQYFMDAGIDYISSGTDLRWNVKALFNIWRKP